MQSRLTAGIKGIREAETAAIKFPVYDRNASGGIKYGNKSKNCIYKDGPRPVH